MHRRAGVARFFVYALLVGGPSSYCFHSIGW
jgi:hypothetical protein